MTNKSVQILSCTSTSTAGTWDWNLGPELSTAGTHGLAEGEAVGRNSSSGEEVVDRVPVGSRLKE